MTTPADDRLILTPSQLNRDVRQALERGFPLVWVEGEISNLARPRSGHIYFSLKDRDAQVRCAMWRNRNQLLRFAPADGQQVLVRARISLYEPRGEYQLLVEHMEEAGFGALQRAFEALKAKLQAEGLFATERKKPLPRLPRRIGVVTSPTGAAIRDILSTLRRRFPAVEVVVFPVQVQGESAAGEIARAIDLAAGAGNCDVLIVGRGGGSLEDLWAFNEETVARAIAACPVPVVSAVGHEVDVTIADFVADVRAPTPTGAAELVTPAMTDWLAGLDELERRLRQSLENRLHRERQRLAALQRHLGLLHPGNRLAQQAQRLDELDQRLQTALRHRLRDRGARLAELRARLGQHTPLHRLARGRDRLDDLHRRLDRAGRHQLEEKRTRLEQAARTLHTVSPLATLGRGYAIVTDSQGRVLRDAAKIAEGTKIEARLHKGRLQAKVTGRSE